MSGKPIVLAGNRLLLSLRNLSCFTASDRIDLLARQPLIRKNSSSARDASMSGAHPPMTAIVVTKKNLPSFSEKRAAVQSAQSPPHAYDDDTLRTQACRRESGAVPSSTAVESALRSALGIGHSETTGTTPVPTAVPQPPPEFSANVSTQDPAILDWSLCDPGSEERAAETEPKPMKTSSTRILRLLHVDENEGFRTSEADRAEESSPADAVTRTTTEADAGSKPVAVAESNSSEPSLTAAGKQDVDDECGGNAEASPSVASAPAKQRRRGARKRKKGSRKLNSAGAPQRSVSDDVSSSDESCEVVGDEHGAGSEVAAGWISELPAGLISSADTEDDDDDPVYSLKPLFTGKYGSSSSTKKLKSSKDNRPNYFVAIQVDDVNVHRTAKKVQDHMRGQEPNIEQALVGIPTLHITLLVLRVNDGDDSLQRAKDSLSRCHQAVKDDLEATPLVLQFQGLDHFKKEVLYVKTIGEESVSRLKAIAQVCQEEFDKAKLDLSSNKAFAPHLTLAKLSKQSRRKNGIKKIEEEWYSAFKDESFGMQKVNSLQLLSMSKPKDERGYYYCSLEHMFGDFSRDQENGDHSECCAPVKSRASSHKIEQKLLKIDAAKEEVKRTISTLTNAKLQELSEAKQELSEAKTEPSEEESIAEVSEEDASVGENVETKE